LFFAWLTSPFDQVHFKEGRAVPTSPQCLKSVHFLVEIGKNLIVKGGSFAMNSGQCTRSGCEGKPGLLSSDADLETK
jgi:hypothetical protein